MPNICFAIEISYIGFIIISKLLKQINSFNLAALNVMNDEDLLPAFFASVNSFNGFGPKMEH